MEGAVEVQVAQVEPDLQDWQGQTDVELADLVAVDLADAHLVPVDWEWAAEEVCWDQQGHYCHCCHYCHFLASIGIDIAITRVGRV